MRTLDKISKAICWINDRNTVVIVFALTLCNFFRINLQGNEETYLAFAKKFMDSSWIPNSNLLDHSAGGNLFFQLIVGIWLKYFSFEQVASFGRILNFLFYAFPLAKIFRRLKISNIEMAFILQLFFLYQSFYAGEWIFGGIEEKSISYIFVFWAIYFLICDESYKSIFFTSIATYFHFLIGGWIFTFTLLYFLIKNKNVRQTFTHILLFLAITLPFLVYLFKIYIINNPSIIEEVNVQRIYTFWRVRHHIGIFFSLNYFIGKSLKGVLITIIMFEICLIFYSRIKLKNIKVLNLLNIIIFSQQIIFLLIGVFDANGVLLKTYPYRTNSISVLLFWIETALIIRHVSRKVFYPLFNKIYFHSLSSYEKKSHYNALLNILIILAFLPNFINQTKSMLNNFNKMEIGMDADMKKLATYLKNSTTKNSVILLLDHDYPYSFLRLTEREQFVVVKFAPTRNIDIYESYKRSIIREKLQKDISLIDSIKNSYRIDYLVTDSNYEYSSLKLSKIYGKHKVFQIQ